MLLSIEVFDSESDTESSVDSGDDLHEAPTVTGDGRIITAISSDDLSDTVIIDDYIGTSNASNQYLISMINYLLLSCIDLYVA